MHHLSTRTSGATIHVIAPSRAPSLSDLTLTNRATERLVDRGLPVTGGAQGEEHHARNASDSAARVADRHDAVTDAEGVGLLPVIGGCTSKQVLRVIDEEQSLCHQGANWVDERAGVRRRDTGQHMGSAPSTVLLQVVATETRG